MNVGGVTVSVELVSIFVTIIASWIHHVRSDAQVKAELRTNFTNMSDQIGHLTVSVDKTQADLSVSRERLAKIEGYLQCEHPSHHHEAKP